MFAKKLQWRKNDGEQRQRIAQHFMLSRRQIDSVHLTLPKRLASLSSCRQKAFKFNTSCGGCVHYRPASRDYTVTLRPLSAASRCAIRTLLKRNQAPTSWTTDHLLLARRATSHARLRTLCSAYRRRRLITTR